jgi:hypothetical protein
VAQLPELARAVGAALAHGDAAQISRQLRRAGWALGASGSRRSRELREASLPGPERPGSAQRLGQLMAAMATLRRDRPRGRSGLIRSDTPRPDRSRRRTYRGGFTARSDDRPRTPLRCARCMSTARSASWYELE